MVAPAGTDQERLELLNALTILNQQIENMEEALAGAMSARADIIAVLNERTW